MYKPCENCYKKRGKSYSKECDSVCMYAKVVAEKRRLQDTLNVLADNVEIIEVSIKLSNNRIVLYEVSGNKYLNLKKISFDSDQTLDKNMEGLLV